MIFEISRIGKDMLKLQNDLAKEYKYKKQPDNIAEQNMITYYNNLPDDFRDELIKLNIGYEIKGKNIPLYSKDASKIANKYNRIVIGHYGAFIEIDPEDICEQYIKCKPGQEYRIEDLDYASRVKYFWMTTKDDSNCKLYFQQKGVSYADYKPNKWYISPYEVCDLIELDIIGVTI